MQIQEAVYAVARLINVASQYMNTYDRKNYIESKVALLDDSQKQSLITVIKAMSLLVEGESMSILRDPTKFDPKATQPPWIQVLPTAALHIVRAADPAFASLESPSKEDYVMAKKVLTAIGSSSASPDLALKMDPDAGPGPSQMQMLGGYDTLYRGLNSVSDRVIGRVASKKPWSIKHGVSTSYKRDTAADFAGLQKDGSSSGNGPSIFFTINNPKKKGFIADRLSDFGEYEVILSGDFQINSWILSVRGQMPAKLWDNTKKREVQKNARTLMQANSETMEIKFIHKEIKKIDVLTFDDEQKFLDAIDKYSFNRSKFETDKLGMPNNVTRWAPNRESVLIAADVTLI